MKKYKLLTQLNYYLHKKGEIYDENYKHPQCNLTIGELAKKYPDAWELVEEEFVLPEKWYIYVPNEEDCKLYWDYFNTSRIHNLNGSGWYYLSTKRASVFKPGKEFLEISIEQFKQYVLGMKEQEQQKEIVGWKPKEKYLREATAAMTMAYGRTWVDEHTNNVEENGYMFADCHSTETALCYKLKQAGVLDLWFTPVYADSTPQITINGYKGEFFDWGVRFGCAEFDKDVFTLLYELKGGRSNRNIESVTIGKGTFTKEQIKQIAEFYLNKNK